MANSTGSNIFDPFNFSLKYGVNIPELIRCRSLLKQPPPNDTQLYCQPSFDAWLCWDYAPAGTVVAQKCPSDFKKLNPDEFAIKNCTADGTWYVHPKSNNTWTDYSRCGETKGLSHHELNLYITIAGYTISIVLLVISLIIFNAFRQLRCTRVIMHQHLFVSFILTGIMWITSNTQFLIWPAIRDENPIWCKVISVITQYASVSNYFWMLCEGIFLYTIIVQAFSKQKKLLYICCFIGWCCPFPPVIAYIIARSVDEESNTVCWFQVNWTMWLLSTPIVLSLVINFVLLLNILLILLSKMRSFNSAEHNQNRRAVKATLILVPLLGLQNMLTLVKPPLEDEGKLVWNMISAILISFQGAAVALIFCFFNGEVLTVLRRRFGQLRHSYDPGYISRPSNCSTMAMTLDDSSVGGPVYKNGNKRDITELQPMMSSEKGDKSVSFEN